MCPSWGQSLYKGWLCICLIAINYPVISSESVAWNQWVDRWINCYFLKYIFSTVKENHLRLFVIQLICKSINRRWKLFHKFPNMSWTIETDSEFPITGGNQAKYGTFGGPLVWTSVEYYLPFCASGPLGSLFYQSAAHPNSVCRILFSLYKTSHICPLLKTFNEQNHQNESLSIL